jgi:hypothetical protein
MNKRDKNIKVENAVVGEFYKIEVDKDNATWEHQWIAHYDNLVVEYLGLNHANMFYPYEFKLIMGEVNSSKVSSNYNRKPGDILMFHERDMLTLKKL